MSAPNPRPEYVFTRGIQGPQRIQQLHAGGRMPFSAKDWASYYFPFYVAAPKGTGVWAMRWG